MIQHVFKKLLNFQPKLLNFQPKLLNFQPKLLNFQPKLLIFQPKLLNFQPKLLNFQPNLETYIKITPNFEISFSLSKVQKSFLINRKLPTKPSNPFPIIRAVIQPLQHPSNCFPLFLPPFLFQMNTAQKTRAKLLKTLTFLPELSHKNVVRKSDFGT
jgi:hypothetical protein